jgi:D-mannose binding lectin
MTPHQDPSGAGRDGTPRGAHRLRRGGILDRWYLLLAVAVAVALIPVAFTLFSDDGPHQSPSAVMPTVTEVFAGQPAAIDPTGSASPTGPAASQSPVSASPSAPAPTPPRTPATAPLPSTLTITSPATLQRGQSWRTASTVVALSTDGDLTVTDGSGKLVWHSDTGSHNPNRAGHQAVLQSDGNLVVSNADNNSVWASGTSGHPGAVLLLQRDGHVCVVDGGRELWCAGNNGNQN